LARPQVEALPRLRARDAEILQGDGPGQQTQIGQPPLGCVDQAHDPRVDRNPPDSQIEGAGGVPTGARGSAIRLASEGRPVEAAVFGELDQQARAVDSEAPGPPHAPTQGAPIELEGGALDRCQLGVGVTQAERATLDRDPTLREVDLDPSDLRLDQRGRDRELDPQLHR